MANFKLTISDVKGKSITKELKEGDANPLMGLVIGAETDAAIVGLAGKLKITGGSDKSGVPMRGDLHGMARKRVLLSKGVGLQDTEHGLRKRKLVRGNLFLELTEKEIKLIELLKKETFVKKKQILTSIWKYSDDADTHTVETHIYRLRKKIKELFNDENLIKSEKEGYTI